MRIHITFAFMSPLNSITFQGFYTTCSYFVNENVKVCDDLGDVSYI